MAPDLSYHVRVSTRPLILCALMATLPAAAVAQPVAPASAPALDSRARASALFKEGNGLARRKLYIL